jgi:hypothetical protein
MKIILSSDNKPLMVDPQAGAVMNEPDSRVYIKLNPEHTKICRRHDGELVLRNGWVHLDYDDEGFLVGLEIVEGDPQTGVTETIPYLQPLNPLTQ